MPDEWLLIGRVARAHGIRGQVVVNPETDFPDERFAEGREIWMDLAGQTRPMHIVSARFHHGRPVIAFEGIETMDEAQALAGAELKIPASEAGPLPGGTYYRHDLIGCDVTTKSGEPVGRVTGVEGPMERSRLVIAGPRGEVMVPLIEQFCVSVDVTRRTIVIDPPAGLLDL